MKPFTVHEINPKKGRKKMARRRRKRKAPTASHAPRRRRRRRRRNPGEVEYYEVPREQNRRRRRRRSHGGGGSRRRRRRNPEGGGRLGGIFGSILNELGPSGGRFAGKLAVAWAVRNFGAAGGNITGGGVYTSPTMGQSWGPWQYGIAALVMHFGPRLVGKFINAAEFRRGCASLIWDKLVWTELFARFPWAAQQFGADGDTYVDPNGQTWIESGGRQIAMQGYGSELVGASPLDGFNGELVTASPLDGFDGFGGYGHLPASVGSSYLGAGSNDPYQEAYSSR